MFERVRIKRSGQTLIEVTIATMIAAMTTVAVFSVVLSSFVSQKKADNKEVAAMLLKQAQQTLQNYVTAVPGEPAYSSNAGGRWAADSSGVWALNAGRHDISSLMNTAAPEITALRGTLAACAWGTGCYLSYFVTDTNCGFGVGANACKTVSFDMQYAD